MKYPQTSLILASLLAIGISATHWRTQWATSATDVLRDSPRSETGSGNSLGDVQSFLDQAKKGVGKKADAKTVAGTPVRATSAVASVYCSGSKNSGVSLIDPDLQEEEQGSWSWTTTVRVVSEKDPKGIELKVWGGSSNPPPTPRPSEPITRFRGDFYYVLGESGSRNSTHDGGQSRLVLGVNVFDTVRVLYKGEVVASCEMTGNDGEVGIVKGVGLRLGKPGSEELPEETLIQVSDQDLDKDPTAVDRAEISVYSDSDQKGIAIKLTETSINTGNFIGSILLTRGPTRGYSLQAKPGDKLHAIYHDHHTSERGRAQVRESVAEIGE